MAEYALTTTGLMLFTYFEDALVKLEFFALSICISDDFPGLTAQIAIPVMLMSMFILRILRMLMFALQR